MLFGDAKPKGKRSFSWPRTKAQLPKAADPLFPHGHGLGYVKL